MSEANIILVDSTLRDGEQAAGVAFTTSEKLHIVKLLNQLGVHQIEAGVAAMGGEEASFLKMLAKHHLKSLIIGWNRAVLKDIEASLRCGLTALAIAISTSDIHIQHKLKSTRQQVIEATVKAVEYAKKEGAYVSANAEDASRSDPEFLLEWAKAAQQAGADRIRYADTVGVLDPFTMYEQIKQLASATTIDIEVHAHNDFGLATANTLAALRGGATHVSVTVNGLGERAGNAALDEIVMALKHIYRVDLGMKLPLLTHLSSYVAQASGRALSAGKPISGSHVFMHESGIHVDGLLKNPLNYEAFDPKVLGLKHELVIGKHSGTAAIQHKFCQLGIALNKSDATKVLVAVRKKAALLKCRLSDEELLSLYTTI